MDLNALTASKIKELRHGLGYTVEAMAKDLGISKTAYSQMENGHVEITLARIEMIADICNIPVSDIIPVASTNHQVSNGSGDKTAHKHSQKTILRWGTAGRSIWRHATAYLFILVFFIIAFLCFTKTNMIHSSGCPAEQPEQLGNQ